MGEYLRVAQTRSAVKALAYSGHAGTTIRLMPVQAERPGKVILVIITDGLENASREHTRDLVFQLIRHQSDVYGWEFVYLGAKQDAIAAGAQVGIDAGFALSCAGGEVATQALYRSLASNVKMRRAGSKADMRWEVRDRQAQRDQGAAGDAGGGGGV